MNWLRKVKATLFGSTVNSVNLIGAVQLNNINMVKMLLDGGSNPNLLDTRKRSPLFYAVMNGNTSIVRILLEYGGNANWQSWDYREGCLLFCAVNNSYVEIFRLLMQFGGIIQNDWEDLLLCDACETGNLEIIKVVSKFVKIKN
jgi:ankyrin repeat protein